MQIIGDEKILNNINLAPDNAYEEVIQNIAIILAMVQKSAPMLRRMGISSELYGRPLPVAENILIGFIYDQLEEYEPRAILGALTFERDDLTGKLIPIIELEGLRDNDI